MKISIKKTNILIICIIVIFSIYHFFIHNGVEKIFFQSYFNYDDVKRPLLKCNNKMNRPSLYCIGMPSGHAETTSVFFFLLYFYKLLPLWITLILITLFCLQRLITNMHTISQVIVGSMLGLMYALIYKSLNLSFVSFLIVFTIGFILILFTIVKIDKKVYGPIPDWVDKSKQQLESIRKKQNSPLYIKIVSLYANSVIQNKTFISWNELEYYLDKMVERIKESNVKFDAIVGIKTGGAIISDYISLKLGLPNYKIKLSREEYNCNKQPKDFVDDIYKKEFTKNTDYIICEGINNNLEGKNIILVDELVSTGKTMEEAYKYLKQNKGVNSIYPTCVSLYKYRYKGNLQINNVVNGTVLIWPWGYDN